MLLCIEGDMERNIEKRVDSLSIMALLTFSGGMQDAYTYFERRHVFANGQTGNIVLMASYLFSGDFKKTLHYIIPILFYALGIFLSDEIEGHKKALFRLGEWQHVVLYLEILLLLVVGLIPDSMYHLANALVSFSCALQVQAFRTVRGYSYASTMCVGNMKLGMAAFSKSIRLKDKTELDKFLHYMLVIFIFIAGAGTGALLSEKIGLKAIWASSFSLMIALILLFIPIRKK